MHSNAEQCPNIPLRIAQFSKRGKPAKGKQVPRAVAKKVKNNLCE